MAANLGRREGRPAGRLILADAAGGPGPYDHGRVLVGGTGDARRQATDGESLGGPGCLALARLGQQVTARRQPERCLGSHPPQRVKPVRAAVERQSRLVQAGLGGSVRTASVGT